MSMAWPRKVFTITSPPEGMDDCDARGTKIVWVDELCAVDSEA
jgi:hypothetical protein